MRSLSRFKLAMLLTLIVGGVASAAAWGLSTGRSAPDRAATWSWPSGVPGEVDASGSGVARASGVDAAAIRDVAAVGTAGERQSLYATRGADGRICLAAEQVGIGSTNFQCLGTRADDFALLYFATSGGMRAGAADHASLVGVARDDVSRVVVALADGSSRQLALNRWRAFGYVAHAPNKLPVELVAYGSDGGVIQRIAVTQPVAPDAG